jgi:hypothetical protein
MVTHQPGRGWEADGQVDGTRWWWRAATGGILGTTNRSPLTSERSPAVITETMLIVTDFRRRELLDRVAEAARARIAAESPPTTSTAPSGELTQPCPRVAERTIGWRVLAALAAAVLAAAGR